MKPLVWIGGSPEGANVRVDDGHRTIFARVPSGTSSSEVLGLVLLFVSPDERVSLAVEWLDGRGAPAVFVEHDSVRLIEAAGVAA